jgi:AraC-like DNA-binding protein
MEHKTWQENEEFAFSFPFRCWESELKDFIYPNHWHEYYEILVIFRGKVHIVINGDVLNAEEGDIVLLDPGCIHSFPSSDPATCIRFFQFSQGFFAREDHVNALVDFRSVFSQKPIIRAISQDKTLYKNILTSLDSIFDEYIKKSKGWQIAIKGELYHMFLHYVRGGAAENVTIPHNKPLPITNEKRFERVFLLINKHFDNVNLDLNVAAQEAALSRFYFTRFFKQRTGQSFYSFLSAIRISHAKEMLLKTDLQIIDIARNCGFSSLSTFFRVFKTESGYTPSQYRREKSNK